jgi:hypothetical protein
MPIFNLISLETGRVVKRIEKNSYDEASNYFEDKYGLDDYYVEDNETTLSDNAAMTDRQVAYKEAQLNNEIM